MRYVGMSGQKLCFSLFVIYVSSYGCFAQLDFTLGTPVNLGGIINATSRDGSPTISADGLELYFSSDRIDGVGPKGTWDIWVATRSAPDGPWEKVTNVGPAVNSFSSDSGPYLTRDGLTLLFSSMRSGGHGARDIYYSTRSAVGKPWSEARNIGAPVNSSDQDGCPCLTSDGLTLYFGSARPGGYGQWDIYQVTRSSLDAPWGSLENLGEDINTKKTDDCPVVSADGKRLFFGSFLRMGGYGDHDIWFTMKDPDTGDWLYPVNLGPALNSKGGEYPASLSGAEDMLYFGECGDSRKGGYGWYDTYRIPILSLFKPAIVPRSKD